MSYRKLGQYLVLVLAVVMVAAVPVSARDAQPGVLYTSGEDDARAWNWQRDIYPEDLTFAVITEANSAASLPSELQQILADEAADFDAHAAITASMSRLAPGDDLRLYEITLTEDGQVIVHVALRSDEEAEQTEASFAHSVALISSDQFPTGNLTVVFVDQYGYELDRSTVDVHQRQTTNNGTAPVAVRPDADETLLPGEQEHAGHDHHHGESEYVGYDWVPHTVAEGETFSSIAREYAVSVDRLREINFDVDPYNLQPGMEIWVDSLVDPEGNPIATHEIDPGESVWMVSQNTGISMQKLQEVNPAMDLDHVAPSQRIRLGP